MPFKEMDGASEVVVTFYYLDPRLVPPMFYPGLPRPRYPAPSRTVVMNRERRSAAPLLTLLAQENFYLRKTALSNHRDPGFSTRFLFRRGRFSEGPELDECISAFKGFADSYSWELLGLRTDKKFWIKCYDPQLVMALA